MSFWKKSLLYAYFIFMHPRGARLNTKLLRTAIEDECTLYFITSQFMKFSTHALLVLTEKITQTNKHGQLLEMFWS